MPEQNPYTPLLKGISQFDVDFVIPRIGVDLPLGIDPFLLFKSRNETFSTLHGIILTAFNKAIDALRSGDIATARYLFNFPEVSEIGLGYTQKGKRGSGVGNYLSTLIIETLNESFALMDRGVRHIEEMQLVSVGIAADRISDIAANLIKKYLIDYTQKQCVLWDIPLRSSVPINHIFDPGRLEWYDEYADLPISPVDNSPIILVPRRIVRTLPWINFADYFSMEFSTYLRAKRVRKDIHFKDNQTASANRFGKKEVTAVTRLEVERIDRYVNLKEETASQAQPSENYILAKERCSEAERLKHELSQIRRGTADAFIYQRIVLGILNYLFNPELIDGELEVKTIDGTERRDIIFTNDSDQSFWRYVRQEHSAFLIMFETKNTSSLETAHFNQAAIYLGDRLGYLGFIVTRDAETSADQRKAFAIYNDSRPRKVILVLSDLDLIKMLDMKCRNQDPMRYIQNIYRNFRQTAQ